MSSRLRSSSVGAAPRQRKLSRSRAESTVSTSLEVRCGCQYFQTDSLIPERVNPIGSRPTSRTEYYTEYKSRPTSRTELTHPTIVDNQTKQPDQISQNNLTTTTPRTSSLLLYRKYRSSSQDKTIKLPSDITNSTNFETTSYNENKHRSSTLLNRKYSRSRSRDIIPKQFSSFETYKTDDKPSQGLKDKQFSSYEEASRGPNDISFSSYDDAPQILKDTHINSFDEAPQGPKDTRFSSYTESSLQGPKDTQFSNYGEAPQRPKDTRFSSYKESDLQGTKDTQFTSYGEALQGPKDSHFSSYEEDSQKYSNQLDFETRNFGFGHLENCDLEIPETEITKHLSFESTASTPPIELDSTKDFKTNIKVSNLISRSDITHAPVIATPLPDPIIDPADIEDDQDTNNYHSDYYKEEPLIKTSTDTPKYQSQNNFDTQSITQRTSTLLARKYQVDLDQTDIEDEYYKDDPLIESNSNVDTQSTTQRTSNLLARKYRANSSQPTINLISTPRTSSNLLARKYRSVSQEKYPTNYKCSSLEGSTLDIQTDKINKNVSFENNKHDLDQYNISKSDNRLSPVLYEVKNRLATIDRNW